MSKVCVFFAEGYEEIEALTVVDVLRRAKIDTKMVSVTGSRTVTGAHQVAVEMDALFEEIDYSDTDMLVLPGGMPGTKNLEKHEALMKLVEQFNEDGRYLSAICAAPSILGHKGILEGKKACCYPSYEPELKGAKVSFENVCKDGKVITARGMGCAIPFALEIIELFSGEEAADQMADSIIYGK